MTRVILAGATGLVGSQVVHQLALASDKYEVHTISRRGIATRSNNLQSHIADTEDWPVHIADIAPDIAVNCLGTTIKVAGSKAAFAAVDFDLVKSFALAAKASGAKQMISVSSVGSSTNSSNFYLSTKGKAEAALRDMKFDRLDIFRPGLLRGDRTESRTGEAIGILLSPFTDALLHGAFRRYRSIDSSDVALAIANLVSASANGEFIHENDSIVALAG